ncbi:MAG TPA: DUF4845 domain-containing protein [Steroidobacteraceae bacterium]|nr:DUF4845 domain-containing protein [Steroidobacteraceae bacterium]HQW09502.1 DUF4845 domain-containing protein [Steroidobacteraceae bacterium]HQX46776.1 DUF4845 domain-containing protein [Steroidobacteraceae bacterium]HQX77713.1 DUF4845 domain-containing protein [Steroidobacteraceae bacterium]HQZ79955.1 DUF4845 domain-containing protein [Steroidobacteraceae bacterium]
MRTRQAGITFIGWLVILVPIALVGYAAIRLTPVLLNYMKVSQALERTATQLASDETLSARTIRVALEKQFDIDSIDFPSVRDIDIHKEGAAWMMRAQYEDLAPLFANASILLKFDKVATID